MKFFLPDTNIFIYAYYGEEPYASSLTKWVKGRFLYISAIVAAEFLVGAKLKEEKDFLALLDKFDSLPVDTAIAQIGAGYRKDFLKKGYQLRLPDCLIAATAKFYEATLVSSDLKDFPMKDIKKMAL